MTDISADSSHATSDAPASPSPSGSPPSAKKTRIVKKTVIVRKVRKADGSVVTTTTTQPAGSTTARTKSTDTTPRKATSIPMSAIAAPTASSAAKSKIQPPSNGALANSSPTPTSSKPAAAPTASKSSPRTGTRPVGGPIANAAGAYRSSSPIRNSKSYAMTVGFENRVAAHEQALSAIQTKLSELESLENELRTEKALASESRRKSASFDAEQSRIAEKEADLEARKKALLNAVAEEELRKQELLTEQKKLADIKLQSISSHLSSTKSAPDYGSPEYAAKREQDIAGEISRMKEKHKLYDIRRQSMLRDLAAKNPAVRIQKITEWMRR